MNTTEYLARYETAQNILSVLIAVNCETIYQQQQKQSPDSVVIALCESQNSQYLDEDEKLYFRDDVNIERIIKTYGPKAKGLFAF